MVFSKNVRERIQALLVLLVHLKILVLEENVLGIVILVIVYFQKIFTN
jgi:hypothetical protein